ncbi:MAG: helix-turn-helix transcriptional regulator [Magnetospiraceae bacterium]
MTPTIAPRIVALIDRIGSAAYPQALFAYWRAVMPFQQMTAWHISRDKPPVTLVAERPGDRDLVEGLCRTWVGGGYADDPILREARPELSIVRSELADYADPAYRSRFFADAGLSGKLSLFQAVGADVVYLNLYRRAGMPAFSEAEAAAARDWGEIALSSLHKHAEVWAASAPPGDREEMRGLLQTFFRDHAAKLSDREAAVCAYALLGYSHEATALTLEVSKSSAITYRNRAYKKLGVTGIAELFALYLSRI